MDFITVTTAGVLLSILLAWCALLEYPERRRRKDVNKPMPLPQIDGSGVARERRQGSGRLVTRQFR